MNNKVLKIVISLAAIWVLLKVVFGLGIIIAIQQTLMHDSIRPEPPVETTYVAGGVPELPEIPQASALPDPLLLRDRALLSIKLNSVVGYGHNGWKLRYNTVEDAIALRPDLSDCLSIPLEGCRAIASRHNAEVLYNGDKRLYVSLRYLRADLFDAYTREEIIDLQDQYPRNRWALLLPDWATADYPSKEWEELEPWQGFSLRRMQNHGGEGAYFLEAVLKGDGKVVVDMLTNAPLDEVKQQLGAMDLELLRAMVSPVPYGGLDALETYVAEELEKRIRKNRFDVLSEEALRAKVAEMTPEQRVEYTSRLVDYAMHRGTSPFDYDILYHPMGEEGTQDTRDFLAGRIASGDLRYDVLNREQERSYPIGSCLQTTVEMFCRTEAEGVRIAAEIRKQADAARDAQAARQPTPQDPEADAGPPYSQVEFQREMREIEAQMQEALDKLKKFQAGE